MNCAEWQRLKEKDHLVEQHNYVPDGYSITQFKGSVLQAFEVS